MEREHRCLRRLERAMEAARAQLYEALERAGGDHSDPEVLRVSQKFDRALVAYMNCRDNM